MLAKLKQLKQAIAADKPRKFFNPEKHQVCEDLDVALERLLQGSDDARIIHHISKWCDGSRLRKVLVNGNHAIQLAVIDILSHPNIVIRSSLSLVGDVALAETPRLPSYAHLVGDVAVASLASAAVEPPPPPYPSTRSLAASSSQAGSHELKERDSSNDPPAPEYHTALPDPYSKHTPSSERKRDNAALSPKCGGKLQTLIEALFPAWYTTSNRELRQYFATQLRACGVDDAFVIESVRRYCDDEGFKQILKDGDSSIQVAVINILSHIVEVVAPPPPCIALTPQSKDVIVVLSPMQEKLGALIKKLHAEMDNSSPQNIPRYDALIQNLGLLIQDKFDDKNVIRILAGHCRNYKYRPILEAAASPIQIAVLNIIIHDNIVAAKPIPVAKDEPPLYTLKDEEDGKALQKQPTPASIVMPGAIPGVSAALATDNPPPYKSEESSSAVSVGSKAPAPSTTALQFMMSTSIIPSIGAAPKEVKSPLSAEVRANLEVLIKATQANRSMAKLQAQLDKIFQDAKNDKDVADTLRELCNDVAFNKILVGDHPLLQILTHPIVAVVQSAKTIGTGFAALAATHGAMASFRGSDHPPFSVVRIPNPPSLSELINGPLYYHAPSASGPSPSA